MRKILIIQFKIMNPIIEVLDNNEQQEQQFPIFKNIDVSSESDYYRTQRIIIIDWEQIFQIYF